MRRPVACFVHRGCPTFLSIAVAHAANAGFRPVVIGDQGAQCRDAEFVDIREFEQSRREFRSVYKHISVSDYEYEAFCYERWFVIRDFMRFESEPLWVFDHDVLSFEGLINLGEGILWSKKSNPFMFNSAWTSLISGIEPLNVLTSYYTQVFEVRSLREALSIKYAWEGSPHLSDMYLLLELSELDGSMFLDAYHRSEQIGIDQNMLQNMSIGARFELLHGYKLVTWQQGKPLVKLRDGGYQRFYTLHFQGNAKYLMPSMAQVPFENEDLIRERCARMIGTAA
ncbi:MAG: hypothetical protein INR71_07420 [Terriglobus roseus]|nr:hypothetical protein [Terriglobus roseus]